MALCLLAMPLAAAWTPSAAFAAEAPQRLIEQARFWEERGRYDLADDVWGKVLAADPDNAQALTALGTNHANAGEVESARQYLERLRKAHPDHGGVQEIRQAINLQGKDRDRLTEARRHAREEAYQKAVQDYRAFFGDNQPSGRLGLEYYQTLAGTEGGWDEARRGLQRLASQNPENPKFQLALAEHLTYRETTRRAGVHSLAELEARPAVASEARAARRQALVWLDAKPSDADLYRQYLRAHPDDNAVRRAYSKLQERIAQQRQQARQPGPPELSRADQLIKEGFAALNDNRLDEAEDLFRRVLDRSRDNAAALGGLGILRLRQERFADAQRLLEQATSEQPQSARRWREALDSARFWSTAEQARNARRDGRLEKAASLYSRALERNPSETAVRVSYADVLAELGRYRDAEAEYRRVLKTDPDNADAQRGVVNMLSRMGRTDEALRFAENIPKKDRAQISGLSTLKAQRFRDRAGEAEKAGNPQDAISLLREALTIDPNNPWIRLDLANLYRETGEPDKATQLVDNLLASEGNMPDAIFVKSLLLAEEEKWWDVLQLLDRVPVEQRTRAMGELQRRAWIRYQTERAVAFAREGRGEAARTILQQVDREVDEDNAEALGALAQAYAEVERPERAVGLMRQALSGLSEPSPGLRLQYAALLFTLGHDVEFEAQLETIQAQANKLSKEQQQGLSELETGYALRQADKLRERGQLADAYERLKPHLRRNPDDPQLLMALARLYDDFGEPLKSLDIYYDVLEMEPQNLNAIDGAVRAAIDAQRHDEAQWLVDRGIDLAPSDPRMYVLAGRLARVQGNDDEAVALFKQALSLDAQSRGDGLGGSGPRQAAGRAPLYMLERGGRQASATGDRGNPFGEPRRDRYEDGQKPFGPRVPAREALPSPRFRGQSSRLRDDGRPLPMRHRQVREADAGRSAESAREAPVQLAAGERYTSPLPRQRPPARGSMAPIHRRQERVSDARRPKRGERSPQPQTRLSTRPNERTPRIDDLPERRGKSPRASLIDEIVDIQAKRSDWVAGGLAVRTREGEEGLGELTDIETPIEGSLGDAGPGRLRVRAVPVFLDAGDVGGSDAEDFGILPLAEAANGPGSAAAIADGPGFDQSETGVSVGAVYELDDWRLDLGATPLGFPEERLVGGVKWTPRWDNILLSLDASRRAVTESLLSYAGTEQPGLVLSGSNPRNQGATRELTFGGVTRTGARLDIANDFGPYGIYGNLGGYFYDGELVEDNHSLEFGGGFYHHLWKRPDNKLTWGVNLTTFFYDENLRHFTVGHGGYFSPQFFTSVGVPVEWVGRQPRLSYRVGGSLGLQTFDEDDTPVFPGDFFDLQTRLANEGGDTTFEGEDNTGVGFNFFGAAEYLLTPRLALGGRVTSDNASDFTQFSGTGYLRYFFTPQRPDRLPPPRVLAPFFQGDPSW